MDMIPGQRDMHIDTHPPETQGRQAALPGVLRKRKAGLSRITHGGKGSITDEVKGKGYGSPLRKG
jgi:hypothetical protein